MKKHTKSVQLPTDLHQDLKEIADTNGFKISSLIENFLRSGVTQFVTHQNFSTSKTRNKRVDDRKSKGAK